MSRCGYCFFFFFQAEDGIRDLYVTGVQTCALPISGDGGGLVLAEGGEGVGGATEAGPRLLRALEVFESEAQMEEGKSVAFGESVAGPDTSRFLERGGALRKVLPRAFVIEARELPERNSQVVESHAAGDLALKCAPFQSLLEKRNRFGQVLGRFSEVGEGRCEVVQGSGVPAALLVRTEMCQSDGEAFPRARQIRGRA